jgi:LCP family protein required for cell wall assembly
MRIGPKGRGEDGDGAGSPSPRRGKGPRRRGRARPDGRPRRSVRFVVTAWVAGVLAAVLVAGALAGYVKYRELWDGIHHDVVTGLGVRPPKYTNAINILMFGSDSRVGLTLHEQEVLHVGRTGCGCSDTIMIVHISPGRHRVTVLNIPRDTMVPMFGCPAVKGTPGEQDDPAAMVQINQTLSAGGPSCLWKTVEHSTGIHIDHFIQLEFTGVVKVINDLGGVDVCVPENISDPNSGLNITAGEHHIDGLTFLEFWRARETVADGSDLKRIDRDDLLLAQVLRGIIHSRLLTSPTKLLPVVEDAAHAVYATDAGLTESDLLQIGESFRGLSSNDVQFIEAVTQPYPPAPAQVEFVQPADKQLFSAIAHDTTLPKKASPSRAHAVLDTINPADVQVQVMNGTSTPNLATTTAASLTSSGFHVVGAPGDAASPDYTKSVVEYASAADLPAARTLAARLTDVTLRKDPGIEAGTIQFIIGSTFSALSASPSASPSGSASPSPSVGNLAKNFGGITGNATCRTDASAFQP